MTPSKIGRYEIKRELDRGGMSTVYLATDPNVGRDVALKLLPREFLHHPSFRKRFSREARIIAALEHPAIVPIYDFGEEDDQPYFVMRYMTGGSLASRLKEGPLPIDEAASVLQRIGSALDHAHGQGIIHRDLKPGNILFDQHGRAYLADFGIARLEETGATLTGTTYIGTPAYMSPEQVQAEADLDGRTDIYALGVILFEVLTGRRPFEAETPLGLAMKHVTDPVPSIVSTRPDLPPNVDEVIHRAMAKNREERYVNAAELMAAVTGAAGDGVPTTPDPTLANVRVPAAKPATPAPGRAAPAAEAPVRPPRRVLPWLAIGGGVIAVLCLAAVAVYFFAGNGEGLFGFLTSATETPTATPTTAPSATPLPPTLTATPTVVQSPTTTQTPRPTSTPGPSLTPSEVPPSPTLRASDTPAPTNTRRPATATATRRPSLPTSTATRPPSVPTPTFTMPPPPPTTPVPPPTQPSPPPAPPTDPPPPS